MTSPLTQNQFQTELHRHLDASLRPSTLLSLAQEKGLIPQSTSLDAFKADFEITTPHKDLRSVLEKFTLFQKVLDRPEILERIAFEATLDCAQEGTRKIEFRYSPGFISEYSHLSWDLTLDSLEKGIQKGVLHLQKNSPSVALQAGLIVIGSRDLGIDSIQKTADFFLQHQDRLIGIDIAGDENSYANSLYQDIFKPLKTKRANITIHAGEASGAQAVWEALELLGAKRIGHGVHSEEDPLLLKHLAQNQICLEMCPTSNWVTSCVPSLENHPLPRYLKAGIPVCINTDDPGIFATDLPREVRICQTQMKMTDKEICQCFQNATQHSFLN